MKSECPLKCPTQNGRSDNVNVACTSLLYISVNVDGMENPIVSKRSIVIDNRYRNSFQNQMNESCVNRGSIYRMTLIVNAVIY